MRAATNHTKIRLPDAISDTCWVLETIRALIQLVVFSRRVKHPCENHKFFWIWAAKVFPRFAPLNLFTALSGYLPLALQSCSCSCNLSVISRSSSFCCDSISSVQLLHMDYLPAFPPVTIPRQRSAWMEVLISATITSRDHLHHKGMDNGKWQKGSCLYMATKEAGTERKDELQRDTFS